MSIKIEDGTNDKHTRREDSHDFSGTELHRTYAKLSYQNLATIIIFLVGAVGLYYKIDQWHRDGVAATEAVTVRVKQTEDRIERLEAQYRTDHDALVALIASVQKKANP